MHRKQGIITFIIFMILLTISCNRAIGAILEVGESGYTYSSIQCAINDASFGDEVIVHEGFYKENIDFKGKAITVRSVHGAYRTTIDGNSEDSVVVFRSGERSGSILDGFTVQKGSSRNGCGIYCTSSSPTIVNCIIRDNSAPEPYDGNGGGIYCHYYSSPSIVNCIIFNNKAASGGGIYAWYYSNPTITNCTICENIAVLQGGGIYCWYHSKPKVLNSILWKNKAGGSEKEIFVKSDSSITVSFSNVCEDSSIYPGGGNINEDPLFMEIKSKSYYLKPESPCIDSGYHINAPSEDHDGIPRPQGQKIDIGAYEYVNPNYCTPRALFTANPTLGNESLEVHFNGSFSGGSNYNGAILSWDFGDESEGTGIIMSHKYSQFGSYDVTLTVTTECGSNTFKQSELIKIKANNVSRQVGEGHQYTSIQDAIDDAGFGEIILVHDGTYIENIDFNGKAIILRSVNGPTSTFIDGNTIGSVVSFSHGEGEDSILEGFTLQGGAAYKGGGISCTNSSSPSVLNCTISNNNATFGGGISSDLSSPCFANCTITLNSASKQGGGVYCAHESIPRFEHCIFKKNTALMHGGGICCEANSPLIIESSFIENNTAKYDGGGIYCYYSSATIINCVFSRNIAFSEGGGVCCYDCSPKITNSTIGKNETSGSGGGIFCQYYASPTILNSIVWGNEAGLGSHGISINDTISISVSYSDIQQESGVFPGQGNINTDPLFIDPNGGDFRLKASSPCIDTGTDIGASTQDIDGEARPKDGDCDGTAFYDMGAHEFFRAMQVTPGKSIQGTINTSCDGDVIILHQGTYKETIDFLGKAITIRSIDPDDHNIVLSTVIDGGEMGTVVTFAHDEKGDSVLCGVTIVNGYDLNGGGILCDHSSPTISQCIIKNNSAHYGGGIYCEGSSSSIINCIINSNLSLKKGGGIYSYNSSPVITKCTVSENFGNYDGGGMYFHWDSLPLITNCCIWGNSAKNGSGIYCRIASPIITNCTIRSNVSEEHGGGIYCLQGASPTLVNCILWDNKAGDIPNEIFLNNGTITVEYSDIQQESSVYPGPGNINEDPLFAGTGNVAFYLYGDSPCIDRGTSKGAPSEDKEGIPRPQGTGLDMGSYEYVSPSSCIPRGLFTTNPQKGLDPLTVEFNASFSGGSQHSGTGFFWDFGDGSKAEGMLVSHTYSNCGIFDVSLTVSSLCGVHKITFDDLIKIKSSRVTKEVGEGYPYTSIHDAIKDAGYGEIILVHDGTYLEKINFQGKEITVRSQNGPEGTIIDADGLGNTMHFTRGEGEGSVLDGFTLQGAPFWASGIYCYGSSPLITNCRIINNKAPGINPDNEYVWGGIYCNKSSPIISNCIISGNVSSYGGGIQCHDSSPKIINCTIYNNSSLFSGGGIYCENSSPIILNSILWENGSSVGPNEIYLDQNSSITVTFSDIQDGYQGLCNISANPLFVNPNELDFHLKPGSPCIDKGTNMDAPIIDMDYLSRPQDGDNDGNSVCDMGAYELAGSRINVFTGGSIQAAIDAGGESAVIILNQGIYRENINFSGKAITLMSSVPDDPNIVSNTIIDGDQRGSVVTFDHNEGPDSLLLGITLQNGSALHGGGVYCSDASPRIIQCNIQNNKASFGGGIFCESSASLLIADCVFIENIASQSGGGIFYWQEQISTIITSVFLYNKLENGANSEISLRNNGITYSDMQLLKYNLKRMYILGYNDEAGRWRAAYEFFGEPCGRLFQSQENTILFISSLP